MKTISDSVDESIDAARAIGGLLKSTAPPHGYFYHTGSPKAPRASAYRHQLKQSNSG
jgi:hypothetical protein